jgi:trimeric autotransporter adhesin
MAIVNGTANADTLNGTSLADSLFGLAGDDTLTAGDGNDTLDGGLGADDLIGGEGNDVYIVDNAGDTVTESTGQGTDTVQASVSYSLDDHIENLTLTGTGAINATGNALANTLTGNSGSNVLIGDAGADVLNGGAGADIMVGGADNDTYFVDNVGDVVQENSGDGTDTVQSSVTYTIASNVESLTLTGVAALNGYGNSGANTLTGNAAANSLNGGLGADTMVGGNGNDIYVVDNAGDVVTELTGEGTDTVRTNMAYTLGSNLENLTITTSLAVNGTGNSLVNVITGGAGANTLDGDAGADTLIGLAGNDVYIVDNTGDVVTEALNEGTDLIQSSVTYTAALNVENLTLTGTGNINATGNALANTLTGNTGNNTLDGGAGIDTMIGGDGDDVYRIDSASDVVTEATGEGTDTVQATVSATAGANVENLTLLGTTVINATGNALDNTLTGNLAANTLDGAAGADTMIGLAGDDTYVVDDAGDVVTEASASGTDTVRTALTYTLGANVENLVLTGTADVDGTGNTANNVITGTTGVNTLDGGTGNDTLIGLAGNDVYIVDSALDVVTEAAASGTDEVQASVSYTLGLNVERLTLTGTGNINATGNAAAETLTGNTGNNTLSGLLGADTMVGLDGNDTYVVDNASDVVTEASAEGTDTVQASISYTLGSDVENLTLSGVAAINATGNADDNTLTGNTGANTLNGGAGADTMIGLAGNDTYVVDDAGDVVTEALAAGTDTVSTALAYTLGSNVENLTLTGTADVDGTGNALVNVLTGNSGVNTLDGGAGIDTMIGLAGNDVYIVDNVLDVVTEAASAGTDEVQASVSYTLLANVESLILTGTSAINATGNADANTLTGNTGNNTLSGLAGADTMVGLAGNDVYVVDAAGDVVTEASAEGTDTVQASISYTLGSDVENLTLTGVAAINATGNGDDNTLTGNTGANTLDGGAGADTLIGLAGDDVYLVDDAGDVVTEALTAGTDTVRTALSYTLTTNVENLVLTGTADVDGTGNALNNVLTGNSGVNTLSGLAGNDTMVGLAGDDVYIVDSSLDVVTEAASGGTDTVMASATFTLGAEVENLTLTGTAAINGLGNALANTLTGNSGANSLNGGDGADTMIGGAGNDIYVYDNAGDVITEVTGEGIDTVRTVLSYTLVDEVENLTLTGTSAVNATGNALDNTLTGNTGNNTLDGAAGADAMLGGTGNDTYIVDDAGDVVTELTGGGVDTVRTDLSYTLGAFVDNLVLTGTADVNGTGNGDANSITGNAGINTLSGGAGIDTLIGLAGDDVYVVDNILDVVTEGSAAGTDVVNASVTYTLSANVEELVLTGTTAINGTGNATANTLTGNSGANTLNGLAGADTMIGLGGNDVYVVDDAGDVVTEATSGGSDTVQTVLSYTLGDDVENLTLTGTSNVNATGNAVANTLTGNAGNNTLDGDAGADTLIGAAGNDVYIVDNAGDVVTELAGGGIDTVRTELSYTLGLFVDNLVLTGTGDVDGIGNADANTLTGNSGANTLRGGAGVDTTIGGDGNDVYIVDNALDVVTELTGEGTDVVRAGASYTLGNFVEEIELTGSLAINATGNALDNTLTGNSAANTLNGMAGADTMIGGNGNDVYVVDDALDVVTEITAEGTDTVQTALAYTLGDFVENLTLTGTGNVNGTGNTLANVLTGNAGNNTLDGDTGADTLVGLAGNDVYIVDNTGDVVTEAVAAGTDTIRSSVTYTASLNVENLVLTDTTAINGTGNALNNTITGNSAINTLDGGAGADTLIGGDGDDVYVIDNVGDVITELTGEGTDVARSSVTYTLGGFVEELVLTGTLAVNGTGNALDNTITGNSAINTLSGGAGADTMVGGNGSDVYVVDDALDVVTELTGEGTADTVQTALATYTLGNFVENLTLTGTGNIDGVGNTLANVLTGNAGNNSLDGGTGADTLVGGAGNDTYVVDNTGDVVTEGVAAGTDTILSSVTYTASLNVENITLTDTTAINATGNALNNTLTGNSAINTLDGGAGNDTMIGGDGDDVYVVDSATDVITELTGEGTDLARASVSYTLGAFVENLTLTGTLALNGTGNTLDNVITGNSAINTLSGGTGTDTLVGGAGNDVYLVDDTDDVVTELSGEGTDTISTAITYNLASISNVEGLTLTGTGNVDGTGNALANTLTGNAGNNTLDGGAGNDTLIGGAGNDTYIVAQAGDVITEGVGAGTDEVLASTNYTISANIERLTLTGTGNISGTGNDLANTLTGNSGNNNLSGGAGNDTIDGGAGNDLMLGGTGDDVYQVDSSTDTVIESAGQGSDTVNASVSFTVSGEVEILNLTGTGNIDGGGSEFDNRLYGNSGNNTMTGGLGSDTYYHGTGGGEDVISDEDGTADKLVFGAGLVKTSVAFYLNGDDLEIGYAGNTADTLSITNQNLADNAIDRFELASGSFMTSARMNTLIADMSAYATANSVSMTSVADVKGNAGLMALINAAWS